MQSFSKRFRLDRRINELTGTKYYRLWDIKSRNSCCFSPSLIGTIKEVAKAYNNGIYKPYPIPTREQQKVLEIFYDLKLFRCCRTILKEQFPPTKSFKGHRYNNKLWDTARVITTNIILFRIHGKILPNEVFKEELVTKKQLNTVYQEIYGAKRMNIEGDFEWEKEVAIAQFVNVI